MYRLPLVLLFASAAAAQQAPPTDTLEAALPAVSVVATRAEADVLRVPARVTVLDAGAVDAAGAASVADLLEARSAASLKRLGPGGLASLSLRGSTAEQTLVLLDGHRIADPQLGQLDLALLPTVLLEGAEVLHGAASALYGTDGVGGVVNLRSVRPAESPHARLTTRLGAWGERSAGAVASALAGPVGVLLAAEWDERTGNFPYAGPLRDGRRTNADGHRATLFGRLALAEGPWQASAGAWYGQAERGVPGATGALTPSARQEDRHLRLWSDARRQTGWGTVRAGGLVQRASLRYNADIGRTWLASGEAEAQAALSSRWMLGGGVSGGVARADHPSLATDADESRASAFAHAAGALGPLRVFPALRLDAYVREAGTLAAVSPRLGLNLRLAPGVHAKASLARAFRAPTFNERFWQPGGNPDLRPETGWTADAGLAVARLAVRAEVTAFASRVRNQVVWSQTAGGHYAPENVARVHAWGLEASAEGARRLGAVRLHGGALYALTDARDRSAPGAAAFGQPVRYVPRHQGKAWLGIGRGGLRLDVHARAVSARPVASDGSRWLSRYATVGARLAAHRPFGRVRGRLALSVDNLADERYQVVAGYPMPPRHASLSLTLDWQ